MANILRWFVFIIVEIVLLPFTLVGYALLMIAYFGPMAKAGVSQTALKPLQGRWLLNASGRRPDSAAGSLFGRLPGMTPLTVTLALGPLALGMRLSGQSVSGYDYPLRQSKHVFNMVGHRTTFFDEAMTQALDSGVKQIVILGAGWDTRAFSLARRDGVRVYEVDRAVTQTPKIAALEAAGIDRENVRFAEADFNKESWLGALARTDFDPAQKTFVLWEGVTYYLSAEAVDGVLSSVSNSLAPGSAITFDYFARHLIEGEGNAMLKRALKQLEKIGEPWVFGISTEPPAEETVGAFLAERGLMLKRFEPFGDPQSTERIEGGLVLAVKE